MSEYKQYLIVIILLGIFTTFMFYTSISLSKHENIIKELEYKTKLWNRLKQERVTIKGIVTKYNPVPEQTDSSPTINAMGRKVQQGDIANNCLPFGTKVIIDGRKYTVRDRMNSRYGCKNFDILSFDYQDAINWGVKEKKVLIIK